MPEVLAKSNRTMTARQIINTLTGMKPSRWEYAVRYMTPMGNHATSGVHLITVDDERELITLDEVK